MGSVSKWGMGWNRWVVDRTYTAGDGYKVEYHTLSDRPAVWPLPCVAPPPVLIHRATLHSGPSVSSEIMRARRVTQVPV